MHCKPIDNKDFQIASATIVGSAFPKFMEMGVEGGGGGWPENFSLKREGARHNGEFV